MSIAKKKDPIELFKEWFDEASHCEPISEPSAMTLATVDASGMPWPRTVLLKDVNERGFTFYTNLDSPKAQHLELNPQAGLCFYWMPLNKQVRILGRVERVSDEEADAYFATRPLQSQIGAWASQQSQVLSSRMELMGRVAKVGLKYVGRRVPRPPFWSGYRLVPELIEFWLRQPFRLHERLVYRRQDQGEWAAEHLYP